VSKDFSPSVAGVKAARLVVLAAALAVSACGDSRPVGTVGHVKGFAGLVSADEPRAVVVARDVLSAGGTAADAAVALYFTLASTYPSTASLGGGGMCIVHDKGTKKTEVLDFVAPPLTAEAATPSAAPAAPRGFFALHAKYGRLRWESLLAEPERLARMGTSVSRALANDIARGGQLLARDPAAKALFFRPDGSSLREGDMLRQPELAGVISRLRHNTGDFYMGHQARELVEGARKVGAALSLDDLRDFKPQWRDSITVKVGNETAHFAPPPAVASTVTAQLVGSLWERWEGASADERQHLMAEAAARAFIERGRWMQPHGWTSEPAAELASPQRIQALLAGYTAERHSPAIGGQPPGDAQAGTGFVLIDSYGNAVACGVTTYGLFGSGRMVPGAGFFLSGSPGRNGPPAVAPMMTVNPNVQEVHFVAAASGGVTAPTALATAFLAAERENRKLDQALATPRVHHNGAPDVVFVESKGIDAAGLQKLGHKVAAVDMPSRVNAVRCTTGRPDLYTCAAATDPRGFGLAEMIGKH
jgi:gamma-glutamyltranspeptidase/glutathione hydrolase